jgi:hypothetical protein
MAGKLDDANQLPICGGKMSTLVDQLEEMRARINATPLLPNNRSPVVLGGQVKQMRSRVAELAKLEGQLVSDLSSTLQQLDDLILQEVRTISAEHEARRANLLNELKSLAMKLDGSLPTSLPGSSGDETGAIAEGPQQQYISDAQRQQRLRDALVRQLQAERLLAPSAR